MSSIDFKITHATEEHAEALAELYLQGYGGKYPLKEFTDPDLIRNAIQQDKYRWIVGMYGTTVIASSVGIKAEWNKSFEHGRAIVYPPEFRRNNIIQNLISKVVSSCLNEGYDLGWFGMRDSKGINFSEKNKMGLVGYFPGIHKVKKRENHLIYLVREGNYRTKRIINQKVTDVYASLVSYVERELSLKDFGLGIQSEDYPQDEIVGDTKGDKLEEHNFTVYYHVEPFDKSVVIGKLKVNKDLIDALENILTHEPFINSEYVQLDVLADKFKIHRELEKIGFKMCAFIPAWFLKNNKRYDCIRFAKHAPSESLDKEVLSRINRIKEVMHPAEEVHAKVSYNLNPQEMALV